LLQNMRQCLLSRLQQEETGQIVDFDGCSCTFCSANRSEFNELQPNFRIWFALAIEVIIAIGETKHKKEFTSPSLVAKYVAGSHNFGLRSVLDEMTDGKPMYGAGRKHLSQANWESVLHAMLNVDLLLRNDIGIVFVSDAGKKWLKDSTAAFCLKQDLASLQNMTQREGELIPRFESATASAAAALDKNLRVEALPTLITNALAVSKVKRFGEHLFGKSLPSNASGGTLLLIEMQVLMEKHPRDLLEPTYTLEKRHSPAVSQSAFVALRTSADVAAFLGVDNAAWSLSIGYCGGVKRCTGRCLDGDQCALIDAVGRQQPCPQHALSPLEHIDCNARTLFLVQAGTMRSLVLPLDRHTHDDLPINKVPAVAVRKIRELLASEPHRTAASIESLSFEKLNGGHPIKLLDLSEAFAVPERLQKIVRLDRKKQGPMGAAQGLERLRELETMYNHPFLRYAELADDPSTPQVIIMFSDDMLKSLLAAKQLEADGTFCTVRRKDGEPDWNVYNGATFAKGKAGPVFHALLNGRSKRHYTMMFKSLFRVWDELQPYEKPSDVLEMIVFDFERAEMAGLEDACTAHWGAEKGAERFKELVRFCNVHWQRIGTKHSKSVKPYERKMFKNICFSICNAVDDTQARFCLSLLGHQGKITLQMLEKCGIPPSEAAKCLRSAAQVGKSEPCEEVIVDWSGKANWASNLLRPKNSVIVSGIYNKGAGTRTTNHVEAGQSSFGLKYFKELANNSSAKTPFHVMESLFDHSRRHSIIIARAAAGGRTGQRSSSGIELRKNKKQESKDDKRGRYADNDDDDEGFDEDNLELAPKSKKVKFDGRLFCACVKGNCDNGRCSCRNKYEGDGVIACGPQCQCKCAKKRSAEDPLPTERVGQKNTKKNKKKLAPRVAGPAASVAQSAARLTDAAPLKMNTDAALNVNKPKSAAALVAVAPMAAASSFAAALLPMPTRGATQGAAVASPTAEAQKAQTDLAGWEDVEFWDCDADLFAALQFDGPSGTGFNNPQHLNELPLVNDALESGKKRALPDVEEVEETCLVCGESGFVPGGPREAVRCTLGSATKPCCHRLFHLVHAKPAPDAGTSWQCLSCQSGGAPGKRSRKASKNSVDK
jgi:hypothetical protein